MNGLMKLAPAFAARSAWFAEKQSVTLTRIPRDESTRTAGSPVSVNGTLTTTFLWIAASFSPC